MATAEMLMTAADFGRRPDPGRRSLGEILIKVVDYLNASVLKVVVLDPVTRKAHVFSAEQEEAVVLGPEDELTLPGLLDGFRVPVHRFLD